MPWRLEGDKGRKAENIDVLHEEDNGVVRVKGIYNQMYSNEECQ